MKALRNDRRTREYLLRWAGQGKLVILDHYLWIAGTPLERSIRALLQSLGYQAVEQYGTLAQTMFPDLWGGNIPLRGQRWNTKQLLAALERLIHDSEFKTCICINGLDECEYRERPELIRMAGNLCQNTTFKPCMSSRPWSDFERAFADWPRVELEKNNKFDIFQLVCERLRTADEHMTGDDSDDMRLSELVSTRRFEYELEALTPRERLIHKICSKVGGNMLWVTIVLDTICQRLQDGEDVARVERYVEDLPADIEQYYSKLVYSRIHNTYRSGSVSECAMAFKLVLVEKEDWPGERITYMSLLQESLASGKGLAHDADFGIKFAPQLILPTYKAVSEFVNSRCRDILGTVQDPQNRHLLAFKHRIAYDFLRSPGMLKEIDDHVPEHFLGPEFPLELALVVAKLSSAGRIADVSDMNSALYTYISACKGRTLKDLLLEAIDETCNTRLRHNNAKWRTDYSTLSLIVFLVHCGQRRFLDAVIQDEARQKMQFADAASVEDLLECLRGTYGRYSFPAKVTLYTEHDRPMSLPVAKIFPVDVTRRMFPVRKSLWTDFLGLVYSSGWLIDLREAVQDVANAYLDAGATLNVDLPEQWLGTFSPCQCPDASVHLGPYECHSRRVGDPGRWINAQEILVKHLGMNELDLAQIVAARTQGAQREIYVEQEQECVKAAEENWRQAFAQWEEKGRPWD